MINEYEKQANDFLEKTGTTFKAEFLKFDFHFAGDKEKRDIYKITLFRGSRSYSFEFGQSIVNSGFKIYFGSGKSVSLDIPESKRDIYLKAKTKYDFINYIGKYGQSGSDKIVKPKIPNSYDVLACLEKYDTGTFEDFCSNFGYDTDSRTAEKTYKAVSEQYKNLCALYSDSELELMQGIN
jgi:hypothetical protein